MDPDTPRDETAIWRYMDLTKFVAMLASNTLWFAKMAEFHDDPFEGFCTVTRLKMPQNDPLAKCITRTTPEGDTHLISLTRAYGGAK